jgi:hypothetical protein
VRLEQEAEAIAAAAAEQWQARGLPV